MLSVIGVQVDFGCVYASRQVVPIAFLNAAMSIDLKEASHILGRKTNLCIQPRHEESVE